MLGQDLILLKVLKVSYFKIGKFLIYSILFYAYHIVHIWIQSCYENGQYWCCIRFYVYKFKSEAGMFTNVWYLLCFKKNQTSSCLWTQAAWKNNQFTIGMVGIYLGKLATKRCTKNILERTCHTTHFVKKIPAALKPSCMDELSCFHLRKIYNKMIFLSLYLYNYMHVFVHLIYVYNVGEENLFNS